MSFLHPSLFVLGAAAIAIPILIHLLLRQRRRPVMWGAMRFLIEAYKRQRQRMKIEQWMLLATRCLLLALLGAALARPLLQGAGLLAGPAGKSIYLLLDTSVASSAREGYGGEDTAALQRHKATASSLLAGLGPADRAGLVLLGGPASAIVSPASADISAVRRLVDDAAATDSAADLAGALSKLAATIDSTEEERSIPTTIVILSDFFNGSADVSRPLPTTLAERSNVRLLASMPRDAARAPGNVQVVSAEPLRPLVLTGSSSGGGEREQVRVKLRRTGPSVAESATGTVRVRIGAGSETGSTPPAQAQVRWQPGQFEASISVQVNPIATSDTAAAVITVEIDRDPIAADNTFRRPVGVREAMRVGVVARARFGAEVSLDRLGPAEWMRLALRPTSGTPMDLIDIEPSSVDTPTLASLDAVVVPAPDLVRDDGWNKLRAFAESGGLVIVSPAAEASVHLWSDAMVRELGLPWRLAREPKRYDEPIGIDDKEIVSPMFELIVKEMPSLARPVGVTRTLPAEELGRETEVLLKLKDGTPWLIAAEPGAGGDSSASGERGSRGLVLYLASAPTLTWTDLPAKPLMVPLVQELVRQGYGRAAGSWSSIAGRPVAAPARTKELRPIAVTGESMPEPMAVTAEGITVSSARRAGLWQAVDEGGRPRGLVAINADTEGARTDSQDPAAVRAWLAAAFGTDADGAAASADRVEWLDPSGRAPTLAAANTESPFSLPLLAAVLALALAELVMARFFSHAFVDRPAGAASNPAGASA